MINAFANWITKHPKTVMFISLILLIPSFFGMILTPINYDILSYLPDELDSVKGINILDENFHEASIAIVIMDGMSNNDMYKLEDDLNEIEQVNTVLWVGSLSNSPIPKSMLPESVTSMLYSDDSTLMIVQLKTLLSENSTLDTMRSIKKVINKQCLMSGMSAMTLDLSDMMDEEVPIYVGIGILLALIALSFTMESFASPFILLASLGMSILYNMGTNFIFGKISFITQAIAAVLQLAVTMDYSVFLMDRYAEEKPKYKTRETAMAKAITGTFTSLAGSSLTTIFGFLALCFMRLTLGRDIGLVMAKGIVFGILSVVIVLPAMLLLCENLIYKTKHKSLIPSFYKVTKGTVKCRKIMTILFVIIMIPAYYGQSNVEKYYNMMDAMPESMESIAAMNTLKNDFNMASSHFIIIDEDLPDNEVLEITNKVKNVDGVSGVLNLQSILGTSLSADILPSSVTSMLKNDGKQLILATSVYTPASDECNAQINEINSILKSYDNNAMITGEGPMYKDLVEVADEDFVVTNIISVLAIFILIAIIFKSISVPFILVISIELAIWINIACSYFSGEIICFITPTIISCVQLGATVDYAILLTTRYREELRKGIDKTEAMLTAANQSLKSIFQSALVFFSTTFGVGLVCDIDIVKSMCMTLARGSVISALVIILFLTPLLVVFESIINKTSLGWREEKYPTHFTIPMLEKMQKSVDNAIKKAEKKEKKINKKNKKKKSFTAKPVPAELVTNNLNSETAKQIESAMTPNKNKNENTEENEL